MLKLPVIFTIIFLLLVFSSCSPPPELPAPNNVDPETRQIQRQSRMISRLTDDVLVALATYNYDRLEQMLDPSDLPLSGAEIAILLLGSHAPTMALGPWDAQKTRVSFDDQLLKAVASLNVTWRLSLNRPPQTSLFTFHFSRTGPQSPWRLDID